MAFYESYAIRCTFYSSGEDASPIFIVLVFPAIILDRAETAVSICRLDWSAAVTMGLHEIYFYRVLIYSTLTMNHFCTSNANRDERQCWKSTGDTKQYAQF